MNFRKSPPSIWLIIFIVGLPILSETIYTPSMPQMADSFGVLESWIEYTLSIYLAGFAVGTLIWGKLSDRHGRKICLMFGLIIYVIACIGCYMSETYPHLMLCRFVQAFGGSVGSVLGQAITRDTFKGKELAKTYSIVGAALSMFPAMGSLTGGVIVQWFEWPLLFLILVGLGFLLVQCVWFKLPETHLVEHRQSTPLKSIGLRMVKDSKVLTYVLIVAACNGISFSYFAEGSFYMIEQLKVPSSLYGATFLALAISSFIGGIISRRLQNEYLPSKVLSIGITVMLIGTVSFVMLTTLCHAFHLAKIIMIMSTLSSMMMVMAGICIVCSNALCIALEDYQTTIGTASSLFGFMYYTLTALFTYGMGTLHNGTLWPMPLYFLALTLTLWVTNKRHHIKTQALAA